MDDHVAACKQVRCPALKPKLQLNGTRLDAVLQGLTSAVATHRGQIVHADTAFAANNVSTEMRHMSGGGSGRNRPELS